MGCRCPVLLIIRIFQLLFCLVILAATADIAHKFAEARQLNDEYDPLKPSIREIIDHLLKTPVRIYIGMAVSIWTIIITLSLIFVVRWRNAKLAPPSGITISLEIVTIVSWLVAFVALALFAIEIEPLCFLADDVPILKKIIENCLIVKTATAFAAISCLFWLITCITVSIQACRARRNERKAIAQQPQRLPNGYALVPGTPSNWTPVTPGPQPFPAPIGYKQLPNTPVNLGPAWAPARPTRGDLSKAEQGTVITSVEMLNR
ncbi:hypothetical protein MMC20_006825 [Loxospora ochrophaea]|nr:hypothetical protein [Loxospora ochrophaea]